MTDRVYVIGSGIISAVGNNVSDSIITFEKHLSGIQEIKYLRTRHVNSYPVGEVKISNLDLEKKNDLPSGLSRTILLSYTAAREALRSVGSYPIQNFTTGFISANTVGGMDLTESFYSAYVNKVPNIHYDEVRYHDCGKPTDYVAKKLGIKDFVTTISTACTSSANSIMLGTRMIRNGLLDFAVAGGVDSLTRFTLNGFASLMIVDNKQCTPLDKNRNGLNLGEGAAYLVLTNAEMIDRFNITPLCEITGYCNVNDAYHQTALSEQGEGPYLAMKGALNKSSLDPGKIDYINMHGTGTANNDHAEGSALARIFQNGYPAISSTKSFTGHTLGASGAVEAVFSVLSVQRNLIFPNYSFTEGMEDLNIIPVAKLKKNKPVHHVLSNSFGFGGNCTSLIFSKC